MNLRASKLPIDLKKQVYEYVSRNIFGFFPHHKSIYYSLPDVEKSAINKFLTRSILVTIAYESGGNFTVYNDSSRAFGLYQMMPFHSFYNDIQRNPTFENQTDKLKNLWSNSNDLIISRTVRLIDPSYMENAHVTIPVNDVQIILTSSLGLGRDWAISDKKRLIGKLYRKIDHLNRIRSASLNSHILVIAVTASVAIHMSGYAAKYFEPHISNLVLRYKELFAI